jgi:hypothetical protein
MGIGVAGDEICAVGSLDSDQHPANHSLSRSRQAGRPPRQLTTKTHRPNNFPFAGELDRQHHAADFILRWLPTEAIPQGPCIVAESNSFASAAYISLQPPDGVGSYCPLTIPFMGYYGRADRRSAAYNQLGPPLVSLHEFNHKGAGYARHRLDYPR